MQYKLFIIFTLFLPITGYSQNAVSVDTPKKFTVTKGARYDRINLSWTAVSGAVSYEIYRSTASNGKPELLTIITTTTYSDTTPKPGYQYFYQITAVSPLGKSKPTANEFGYARINVKRKFNLDSILDSYTNSAPSMTSIDRRRCNQLDQYYLGWIKMKFIMFIGKPYVNKGTVSVFTNFENFNIDEDRRAIVINSKDGDYRIVFGTNKFFKIYRETGDRELMDTLVRNGVAFCVFQKDIKSTDAEGNVRYIPQFEALGLATQYFKRNKKWASNTIMFGTSNDELMGQMKNIEKKASN